jgi:hypothetical protein
MSEYEPPFRGVGGQNKEETRWLGGKTKRRPGGGGKKKGIEGIITC